MKEKLLIIDGYSIICRGFYALPLLENKNGNHTNALLGFFNILFRTLDEEKPKYIAVAFDENVKTFRHEMYDEYKGKRDAMPVELKEQVAYVKEMLSAMKISMFSKPGYEADDIVGTISKKLESSKVEPIILSGDKDMLQLASKNTKIRLVKTLKSNSTINNYYETDVEKEYNLTPTEFIDLKALMGDTSDNIPGVKGIGKVTATKLMEQYKSIDNIYKHLDEIEKPSIKNALERDKDKLYLFKKLVTIVRDVDIDVNLDDLEIKNIFNDDSYKVVEKYELNSLKKKFGGAKSQNTKNAALDDFTDIANEDDDIDLIFSKDKIYDDDNENISYNLKKRYKKLDTDTNIFDRFDINKKIDDLSLMAYIIDPLKKDYDDIYHIEQKELYDKYKNKLESLNSYDVYDKIDLPLVKVLYNIEKIGVGVSKEKLSDFSKKLSYDIKDIEDKIYELADEKFNINSPKQLGEVLFNKLGLDYDRKDGEKQSTGIEVLEKLYDKHEIIKHIMNYRTYTKLLTTYADALPKYIVDGRIHTNFNQTETATGRLSSDNPNLQNIPIRTELGRELRKAFIPREGFIFLDADYSQIELRILAILSNDENLINAYKGAEDVHSITASQVFSVDLNDVTKEMRRKAKAINFGIVYGMSSFGLSEDLHIDMKEAKEYIDRYFEKYANVKRYLDETVETAKELGYVKTYYGRVRPIPEFKKGNYMQKAFAKRVAMNSPIQGTAADIMKIAMINVDNMLHKSNLESRIVLQVHDEILIECKIGEEEKVRQILKTGMTDYFKFPIELAIEINEGDNWEAAH